MQDYEKTILNILKCKDKSVYNFYFVGIGGISMHSLCVRLLNIGQKVGGSDARRSKISKELQKLGVKVHYGHNPKNVLGADFVIYSFAVRDNVEVKKAQELKIPTISRSKFLSLLLKCYKTRICVAGAHGKTTTTALIYHILNKAGLNPSLHLGGFLTEENISYKYTSSNIIVCEACEYMDAFLDLKPTISVVLNTAPEHLDYFKTYKNVNKSFNAFAKSSDMLICNNEHKYICNNKKSIYFGKSGDYVAKKIVMQKDGTYKFDVYKYKKYFARIHLNLVGIHNVYNALAGIAVACELGVKKNIIKLSLSSFGGVKRRFEVMSQNPYIVHDYAHHPDEIRAVLKTASTVVANNCDNNLNKLLVVFQPHTYSRTKMLMGEFVDALKDYKTAIYKTYSAREKYDKNGSALSLCNTLGETSVYFNKKNDLIKYAINKIAIGYSVIFLGAGDIDKVCQGVFNRLNKKTNRLF